MQPCWLARDLHGCKLAECSFQERWAILLSVRARQLGFGTPPAPNRTAREASQVINVVSNALRGICRDLYRGVS